MGWEDFVGNDLKEIGMTWNREKIKFFDKLEWKECAKLY
jgi:hypothetical protein